MRKIAILVDHINDEVKDAETYASLYLRYKDDDTDLAQMYKRLAQDELEHSNIEHEQVVRIINQAESQGKDAPDSMKAIWDWEHEKIISRAKEVKMMLSM